MTAEGDNPFIGLLLRAQKDHALVKYALTAIDSRLFVLKHQSESASKKDLQRNREENAGN